MRKIKCVRHWPEILVSLVCLAYILPNLSIIYSPKTNNNIFSKIKQYYIPPNLTIIYSPKPNNDIFCQTHQHILNLCPLLHQLRSSLTKLAPLSLLLHSHLQNCEQNACTGLGNNHLHSYEIKHAKKMWKMHPWGLCTHVCFFNTKKALNFTFLIWPNFLMAKHTMFQIHSFHEGCKWPMKRETRFKLKVWKQTSFLLLMCLKNCLPNCERFIRSAYSNKVQKSVKMHKCANKVQKSVKMHKCINKDE